MQHKGLGIAALAGVVALTGTGSVLIGQQPAASTSATDSIQLTVAPPADPAAAAPRPMRIQLDDDRPANDDAQVQGEAAIRRHDDDDSEVDVVTDDDDAGDGDGTRGDDGTGGGNNTGDGDGTRGDDGTGGGNNTGDGDGTRGDDGTGGGNNTGDGDGTGSGTTG